MLSRSTATSVASTPQLVNNDCLRLSLFSGPKLNGNWNIAHVEIQLRLLLIYLRAHNDEFKQSAFKFKDFP